MKICASVLLLASSTSAAILYPGQAPLRTSAHVALVNNDLKVPGKNGLMYCEDPQDNIGTIDYINFAPNPPIPGQNVTITAGGTLSQAVDKGATIHVTVKYGWLYLINKWYDLCENAEIVDEKCPIKKGGFEISKEIAIPSEVPKGTFTVTADAYNTSDATNKITCLKGAITFI